MKIYLAGGEGLTAQRQTAMFEAGCRNRLTSFFSGKSMERVLTAAENFEKKDESESDIKSAEKIDSDTG